MNVSRAMVLLTFVLGLFMATMVAGGNKFQDFEVGISVIFWRMGLFTAAMVAGGNNLESQATNRVIITGIFYDMGPCSRRRHTQHLRLGSRGCGCPQSCAAVRKGCPDSSNRCRCEFYPGMLCCDLRFTSGDGYTFYFHDSKDRDFCVFNDAGLHINAHFTGSRDFTWIQALGSRFAHQRLYIDEHKSGRWSSDIDRLVLAFDGDCVTIPTLSGSAWRSAVAPALTVKPTTAANGERACLEKL